MNVDRLIYNKDVDFVELASQDQDFAAMCEPLFIMNIPLLKISE
jgi:hypothetical protein